MMGKIAVCSLMLSVMLYAVPPVEIPCDLFSEYTMEGNISVVYHYRDDSCESSVPRVYEQEQIEGFVREAKNKQTQYYGLTDNYLYSVLDKYTDHILHKEVAVLGSVVPWYEAVLLSYEAIPITIEYNKIISNDPRLKLMTVEEYDQQPMLFDSILSISSFEHDGLGRYGDPLNPIGDLRAMEKVKKMLKPGGLLFLAVPVGPDLLVWNLHRIYGPLRLKELLKGWKVLDTFGFSPDDLNVDKGIHQPLFVLTPE